MINPPDDLDGRLSDLWTSSIAWLTGNTGRIAIGLALAGIVAAILFGTKWTGKRLKSQDADLNHWRAIIGGALAKTRLWFIAVTAAQVLARYAHAPDDLARTIHFLFVIAATLQAAVFVREVVLGMVEYRARDDQAGGALASAMGIIRLLVTAVLFAIAIVLILSNLGVNVTGLLAGLGVGGIAIGLAAQGIFRDLFAALSILLDRPFVVGDVIRFGDVTGRVTTIGLKTTRIRSLDGEEVIMSNDKLLDQQLRNFHGIESRRIVLSLPLHYANAPESIAALPDEIETMIAGVADSRFGHALLTSFDANAVMFEILLHSTKGDADVRDRVRHEVMSATLAHLKARSIALSYQASEKPA